MGRFDYIQYDDKAKETQQVIKNRFQALESIVCDTIVNPRAKALVMMKLEEAYMWVGKGIRDDQIERNGSAKLQEQRSNS